MDNKSYNLDDQQNEENQSSLKVSDAHKEMNQRKEIMEWVQAIAIALIIALVVRTFVFSLIKVNGNSMLPTLHNNDRLVVVKLFYKPHQGDIIILNPPQRERGPFVKRIIAVSGQTVDIDFKKHIVYVDGHALHEDYINEPTAERGNVKFPATVPENSVFVMGDNRNNSRDSRFDDVGMIPYKDVIGKVTVRIWPLSSFGLVH